MGRLIGVGVLALAVVGCGGESTDDPDGGTIRFDAMIPDAPELCGNGSLNPGEQCDDGNRDSGDGCDADCDREPFCGDNEIAGDEVCDDGNQRSGDGCRADCMSDESCGNEIVDFAAGEVCDSTPGCNDDCDGVAGCGDGDIVSPETCDDSNTDRWDGCDSACQSEYAMVVRSLALTEARGGCDFNDDGNPDNRFASALGLASVLFGQFLRQSIDDGSLIMMTAFLGLEDENGANDDALQVAWLLGADADETLENNFTGAGEFYIQPEALMEDGTARTSLGASIADRRLEGGPETIPIPLGLVPIELQQGRIEGVTVADSGELYELTEGLLCGGIPISLFGLLGGAFGGGEGLDTAPACDGGDAPNLPDLIIAGGTLTAAVGGMSFMIPFRATTPDLDLDGDGLEGFEILSDGPDGCQPVVVACTDGDGTRLEGRNCYQRAEIQDGYSASFDFEAIQARILGIEPAADETDGEGSGS